MTNSKALHQRRVVVESRRELTDAVTALVLRDADRAPISFIPGQHLSLEVPLEPEPQVRSYSIVSAPRVDSVEIFVKLGSPHGAGNWLREHAEVGCELTAHDPQGGVALRETAARSAFIAAGSGVAGVLMLATTAARAGAQIHVLHSDDDSRSAIGGDELRRSVRLAAAGSSYDFHDVSLEGLVTAQSLLPWLKEHQPRWVYLCGPAGFMQAARSAAAEWGLPAHRVVAEAC